MASILSGRSLISITDLSKEELLILLDSSASMEKMVKERGFSQELKNKLIAVVFLEPSTRTRLSFEAAAQRLGASIISVSEPLSSSQAKGETLLDTVRVISSYADCLILRQPQTGAAKKLADYLKIPLINAGDGSGEHPTQALLDIYTIYKELGSLEGISLAVVGDLKYGRTVHSLLKAFIPFKASITCCAPAELDLPLDLKNNLLKEGLKLRFSDSIKVALDCDVVYMTRIQRERFTNPQAYERLKGCFVLNRRLIEEGSSQALILHPLPRVDEITEDVDDLKQAAYFRQAQNGMYVRMALLKLILS